METPVDRPATSPSLLDHFAALEDPRQRAKVLYPLPEILLLLLCATLAGADDLAEIELWGEEHRWVLSRSANPQPLQGFALRRRPWPGPTVRSMPTSAAPSSA